MMRSVKIIYWEDDGAWIGYLDDYPDYWTQGSTLDDLRKHLKDLYWELTGGILPAVRRRGDLIID
jgi:predicted RNase H-like HicB family nuclease